MGDHHTPTLNTLESVADRAADERPSCRLVILLHPDPTRIGEAARLLELGADLPVAVSRAGPRFGPRRLPLGHPRVSRSTLWLVPERDGVRLSEDGVRARVDGVALSGERRVPWEQIDGDGVFIELGGCVLLWLHQAVWPRPAAADLGLVGVTPSALALQEQVATLSRTRLPLLIVGPTGSGKERVARAIHAGSDRADGPFVALAAAELTPERASALLFGGPGALALADGGTLLLDEVADLDPLVQPLLLRALDTGEARAVGGPHRPVDVRTLSTASAPVGDSDLRLALLHRLRGAELRIPPLRERRADIPVLFHHFLSNALVEAGHPALLVPASEQRRPWLGSAVCAALTEHTLPGNARELRNLAVEVVARCAEEPEASLPKALVEDLDRRRGASEAAAGAGLSPARVREVLAAEDWRVGPAARALGVAKNTLLRAIRSAPDLHLASDLSAEEVATTLDATGGDVEAAAALLRVSSHGLKLRMRELGPL